MAVTVEVDDLVMLIGKDRKHFIRRVRLGEKLQTHQGEVRYDDLVGVPYGSEIRTHLGHSMFVLPPSTHDLILNLRRKSQIMFPKDLGYIMMKMSIQPGTIVAEAGTGSGGLTLALATLVGADGHVFSYDRRTDMQRLARQNIRKAGLEARVTFKQRDIGEGFDETDLDAIFLDVLNPWEYLTQARTALKGGGWLGTLLPTMNQVQDMIRAFYDSPTWFMIELEETLLRTYKTVPQRIRPEDRMVAHTGYLLFARAITRTPVEEDEGDRKSKKEDKSTPPD